MSGPERGAALHWRSAWHNGPVPSGRVHNLINIAVYTGLAAGALYLTQQKGVVITPAQGLYFSLGYGVGTLLLSPDLDLAEGNVDSKRRWGLLGFLWVPYGVLFSHRGLSHTWILGPLTRLLYLGLMVTLMWGLVHALRPHQFTLPLLGPPRLGDQLLATKLGYPLLIGYYLSQWLHLMADGVRPDHGLKHSGRKLRGAARRFR